MNVDLFKGERFSSEELARLNLLFWCLAWAMQTNPLDRLLRSILDPADSRGYCGGDPGWEIDSCEDDGTELLDKSGQRVIRFWALSEISGIEPETAYYTLAEVRYYIRLALENIAKQRPERALEAEEIIRRYFL